MHRTLAITLVSVLSLGVAEAQSTREVTHTDRALIRVNSKVRFTTMIILPDGEQILDFVCGDKDFWVVSGAENVAYVKPAKPGARTNLNLVTASGHVYTFLLTEGMGEPDLTLYVMPDASAGPSAVGTQRFYSATQVEDLRRQIDKARKDVEDAQAAATTSIEGAAKSVEERIDQFRATYPLELRFPYAFKANETPFNVSAIFHDGRFTYIRAEAVELPSLYELRDGAPNLVNFQVEHGTYVVPKVLERGYLSIGKQRFFFGIR